MRQSFQLEHRNTANSLPTTYQRNSNSQVLLCPQERIVPDIPSPPSPNSLPHSIAHIPPKSNSETYPPSLDPHTSSNQHQPAPWSKPAAATTTLTPSLSPSQPPNPPKRSSKPRSPSPRPPGSRNREGARRAPSAPLRALALKVRAEGGVARWLSERKGGAVIG